VQKLGDGALQDVCVALAKHEGSRGLALEDREAIIYLNHARHLHAHMHRAARAGQRYRHQATLHADLGVKRA